MCGRRRLPGGTDGEREVKRLEGIIGEKKGKGRKLRKNEERSD